MLYTFLCESCGEEFDKSLPMSSANSRPNCTRCNSNSTRRTFSAMPVVVVYNEERFTKQLSKHGREIWAQSKAKVGV